MDIVLAVDTHIRASITALHVVVRDRKNGENFVFVGKFKAFRLAFMGPDQHLQLVPMQKVFRDVRTKITPATAKDVWPGTQLRLWIAPENVKNLKAKKTRRI